jgi:hypothetical protein
MPALLAVLTVGVTLLLLSGSLTRSRVRAAWGEVDEISMRLSQGNGTVPSWISLLGLLGWLAIAVGGIGSLVVAIS